MRNACHVPPHHQKHSFRHTKHTHARIHSNTLTPWSTNSHGTLLKPPSVETEELLKVSITWIMCCMNNVFFPLVSPFSIINAEKQELHLHKKTKSAWVLMGIFTKGNKLVWLDTNTQMRTYGLFSFVSISLSDTHTHPFLFDVCQSSTIPYSLPCLLPNKSSLIKKEKAELL